MKLYFRKFLNHESGATAVEYALLCGGIGLVVFAALSILGGNLSDVFSTLSEALT